MVMFRWWSIWMFPEGHDGKDKGQIRACSLLRIHEINFLTFRRWNSAMQKAEGTTINRIGQNYYNVSRQINLTAKIYNKLKMHRTHDITCIYKDTAFKYIANSVSKKVWRMYLPHEELCTPLEKLTGITLLNKNTTCTHRDATDY